MTLTKTIISTIEGVTWTEGEHYRLVGPFGTLEVIKIPRGVQSCLDRKGKRIPKQTITIRYGHTMEEPA